MHNAHEHELQLRSPDEPSTGDLRPRPLERCASSLDVEILTISRFYLNQMIGDLSYSINKRAKGRIQCALIELCDRLEIAERYGDGELDVW